MNPIFSPDRRALVKEAFDQILNQLKVIEVNPQFFCDYVEYQNIVSRAIISSRSVDGGPWTVHDEVEQMLDFHFNNPDFVQLHFDDAMAVGAELDPEFGINLNK